MPAVHTACEDYRASAGIDLVHDKKASRHKVKKSNATCGFMGRTWRCQQKCSNHWSCGKRNVKVKYLGKFCLQVTSFLKSCPMSPSSKTFML
jgi:hypothetical protein